MTEEDARRRFASERVARLATVGRDGRPHLVPICFAVDGDRLYSSVDAKPKRSLRLQRLENVRRHPHVSVLADRWDEDWSRLWWVLVRGRSHVCERGAERDEALTLLSAKYEQYRREPPPGAALVVEIAEWRGWSAS